jgi:phosphoenolpyruvate carboxykinase (GTP)
VEESFDWEHGVLTKAALLESETTAATLGRSGERVFNPMANIDFLSITIGEYIESHIKIGRDLKNPPPIFSANYFLKDSKGRYLNSSQDKRVWLKWMELRAHGDVGAVETPTGYVPRYEDLRVIFRRVLGRDYARREYEGQFTLRIPELLRKIERMVDLYSNDVFNTPGVLLDALENQQRRLTESMVQHGEYIRPKNLELRSIESLRGGGLETLHPSVSWEHQDPPLIR